MTDAPGPGAHSRIDQLSDRFEAEWRAGRSPSIEAYLAEAGPEHRPGLLRELLAVEVECRQGRGEQPLPEEYNRRFPEDPEPVLEAFYQTIWKPTPAAPPEGEGGPQGFTLAVTAGPHAGQTFTLIGHEVFLFGRSKRATLQIRDDKYFSRVHFLIEVNPPQCRLTDMNSRNHTFVNDQQVVQPVALSDGDRIRAGHTTLVLSSLRAPANKEEVPEAETLVDRPPTGSGTAAPRVSAAAAPPAAGQAGTGRSSGGTSPAAAPAPLPRIPGYRVERLLGAGGMGSVYLAIRESNGARIALKVILLGPGNHRHQTDRFLREARILSHLQHEHVVAFHEMGEADGQLFFSMDYVEGTDAARLLRKTGPLPVATAVRIACQALSGLDFAHGKGFVHRDVKPANLLVAEEGSRKTVKLADFGLSRVYQESQLSGLTLQGDIGGTFPFMPPEHITHFRQAMPPADQYGTAATLYNLLTGRYLFEPFPQGGAQAIPFILEKEPVPIRDRRADLPAELAAAIHRALAKEPAARFPTARAFRAALVPFAK